MIEPTWQSEDGGVRLYLGDCMDVLPTLEVNASSVVLTDPPYLTDETSVPIRGGGVTARIEDSNSVGMPWGYSLDWIDACDMLLPTHWIIYANYRMLGGICSRLKPQTVFVWRKSNAPRMTRPVPRLDCEFILWSRSGGKCDRMGEFDSMVIDVPMPQAGCFADERILIPGTGKAAHPCQKPIAVVQPFVDRLNFSLAIDPYMGTGTNGEACIKAGRSFIGIENDPTHFETAKQRIIRALADEKQNLFREQIQAERKETQASMFED